MSGASARARISLVISSMSRDAGDKLNDRELFDQIFGICGASLSATSRAAAVRCTCFTRTTTSANN